MNNETAAITTFWATFNLKTIKNMISTHTLRALEAVLI
jgi:hypothetical protein